MKPQEEQFATEERSLVWAVSSGVLVSILASVALARVYLLIAELLYRWMPDSQYAKMISLLWFDPGVRGDILLVALLAILVHAFGYPLYFRNQPKQFHFRYLIFGSVAWLTLAVFSTLFIQMLMPLQSPL